MLPKVTQQDQNPGSLVARPSLFTSTLYCLSYLFPTVLHPPESAADAAGVSPSAVFSDKTPVGKANSSLL